MEKVVVAALPLVFLAHLLASEAVLAARGIALGGRPPIDRRLFLGAKYTAIVVWMATALQGWGVGFPLLPEVPFLRGVALAVWILGFAALCLGRVSLGSHLRIGLPGEATELHGNGAYRFSRNPMYAGLDATMIAAVLYTRNPVVLALAAIVIAIHHGIILAEETWLLAAFGEGYARYRDRVGRYVTLRTRRRGARRNASPGRGCSACAGSEPGRRPGWRCRALGNLMKMGHCAPTIMRTVLDVTARKEDWLVRLAAGLPGGIGNTGGECGGITAMLVLLGIRHPISLVDRGLPAVFDRGLDHLQRFRDRNATIFCREIRGDPPRIWPCIRTVVSTPELYAPRADAGGGDGAMPGAAAPARAAHCLLYSAFTDSRFHCAHAVLSELDPLVPASRELMNATGPFLGGTVFQGLTCSALAAGVMALGMRLAEIETSRWRVLRMVALLATGGPAFDDRINKFNRIMNRGGELAAWFAAEIGSTQCRAITGADFSSAADVRAYLERGGIGRCREIAARVAGRVRSCIPS